MIHHPDPHLFVAVETGAAWPTWIEECRPGFVSRGVGTHLVVQHEDEPPAAFADRVRTRIESIVAAGSDIDVAVIACSERADASALMARRRIGHGVLGPMARRQTGKLLFAASARSGGRSRQALSELAAEFEQAFEAAGPHVAVRFGRGADAERRVA